jgi:hypothetical protein
VARVLFLIAAGFLGRIINNDGHAYFQIASSLLAGDGFASGPGHPTAFRPFGYPFFLAAIYGAFGESVVSIQICQALLGGLLVLPTVRLAQHLVSPLTAALIGLGVTLHPILLYLPALIAPGAAAVFLQVCLIWLALRISEGDAVFSLSFFGFVLAGAAAILMRPELLLLPVLLALGYLLSVGPRSVSARILILAASLAIALAVVPPLIRNYAIFDAFIPLPTVGGVTFWGANNAAADGGWILPSAEVWPNANPPAGMQGWRDLTEKESQARFYATSWAWIKNNPGEALALIPRKILRSWTLSYADQNRENALPVAAHVVHGLFVLFAFAGLGICWRRSRAYVWLLAAPIVAWLAKTVVFYGSARQTAVVLPVLCVLSGVALEAVGKRLMALVTAHRRRASTGST